MRNEFLAALGARIKEALGGKSAETFANESGGAFKKSTLGNWMKGRTAPGADDLLELARLTGRDLSFFLPVEPDAETEFVSVQKLDVRAAAGGGAINDVSATEERRDFPLWMLQKLTGTARGKPSRLHLIRVAGESMEPLIKSGALLLVDVSDRDHRSPPKATPWMHTDIYVFWDGDGVRVKRLHVDPKGVTIALSENPAYGPDILRRQDFKVLGRVIWWDNRL